MAKLKNYNGRYCESEYESAFIAFLQSVGWTYLPGNKIKRCYRDVLIADDFRAFITKANTDLLEEEIEQIYDTVRLVGAESDFATLHKVYKWMVDGIQFTPQSGLPIQVNKIVAKTYQEMLEETIAIYHERRKHISAEEAGATQEQASEDIIKNATEQALQILRQMNESRESFRKIGLTFEEKAFYDILVSLRDQYNFEYGEDKEIGGMIVNDKCKILAKKVKEIIDTKSSFSDWLNNQNVRNQLKLDIKICLVKNGYPPQYSPEVFTKVMEQVENFEENSDMPMATTYTFPQSRTVSMVAEDIIPYGNKSEN